MQAVRQRPRSLALLLVRKVVLLSCLHSGTARYLPLAYRRRFFAGEGWKEFMEFLPVSLKQEQELHDGSR